LAAPGDRIVLASSVFLAGLGGAAVGVRGGNAFVAVAPALEGRRHTRELGRIDQLAATVALAGESAVGVGLYAAGARLEAASAVV
jgi:hypothetical protein